jgi:mono/diheme cytochrome c family protein
VFALLGCVAPVRAQEVGLPATVSESLIAEGREIFLDQGMCWACHGVDATGARGVGADLTDEEWWHSDGSYEAIVAQILSGVTVDQVRNKLGAVMPPKGGSAISDDQVRAVAAYVWSLRVKRSAYFI